MRREPWKASTDHEGVSEQSTTVIHTRSLPFAVLAGYGFANTRIPLPRSAICWPQTGFDFMVFSF